MGLVASLAAFPVSQEVVADEKRRELQRKLEEEERLRRLRESEYRQGDIDLEIIKRYCYYCVTIDLSFLSCNFHVVADFQSESPIQKAISVRSPQSSARATPKCRTWRKSTWQANTSKNTRLCRVITMLQIVSNIDSITYHRIVVSNITGPIPQWIPCERLEVRSLMSDWNHRLICRMLISASTQRPPWYRMEFRTLLITIVRSSQSLWRALKVFRPFFFSNYQ